MSTETPATSKALVDRVDAGWRPFRDAVRAIGRARMNEATVFGWTYRDLLAHVAAWEHLTARRLRTYRETGERVLPEEARDIDGFNARVAESHRLVGAEALIDELETAHRRLVEEIRQLSDEQVSAAVQPTAFGPEPWVVAVVAGNSYGHYAEHAQEVGLG